MCGENQPAALFDQKLERGQRLNNASGIGDDHLAIFFVQGHIIIHAQKNPLAADIQITNRQFRHIFVLISKKFRSGSITGKGPK